MLPGCELESPSDDLIAAAHAMREKHVGYLIASEHARVIGVLTDRAVAAGCA